MNVILVSLNLGVLAVFYTIVGAFTSYIIYNVFEEYDDDWKKSSFLYQVTDISLEITLIATVGFWLTYIIKEYPPMVPMSRKMDSVIDTYISGVFFSYSMFIFLDDLTSKIEFIYKKMLKDFFA